MTNKIASEKHSRVKPTQEELSDQVLNNKTEELSDEALNQVSGGVNPQSLPSSRRIPPNPC